MAQNGGHLGFTVFYRVFLAEEVRVLAVADFQPAALSDVLVRTGGG